MSKVFCFILIIILCLQLVGCYDNSSDGLVGKYYFKPMQLLETEQDMVELLAINEQIYIYEYHFPQDYSIAELYHEHYEDGAIIGEESIAELPIGNNSGKLIIKSRPNIDLHHEYKFSSVDIMMYGKFRPNLLCDLEAKFRGFDYLTETIELEESDNIVIGAHVFTKTNGIRVFSASQFQLEPSWVKNYDYVILLKLRLK